MAADINISWLQTDRGPNATYIYNDSFQLEEMEIYDFAVHETHHNSKVNISHSRVLLVFLFDHIVCCRFCNGLGVGKAKNV